MSRNNETSAFLRDVVYEAAQKAAIRNERERILAVIKKRLKVLKQNYHKGEGLFDRSEVLADLLVELEPKGNRNEGAQDAS